MNCGCESANLRNNKAGKADYMDNMNFELNFLFFSLQHITIILKKKNKNDGNLQHAYSGFLLVYAPKFYMIIDLHICKVYEPTYKIQK